VINNMPNLKLIQTHGVGYNYVDLEAARKARVYVCNNANINSGAVAEQVILLMLAILRNFRENEDMVYSARQAEAKNYHFENALTELGECHVGIVGFGAIGREVAKRLQAFGCKLSYYDIREVPCCEIPRLSLDELYSKCDIITLHAPVTEETRGMIDEAAINKMKPGTILINTARGELVDQEALSKALIDGRLGGAGIDTLYPEPVQPENPLLNLPPEVRKKVALSPHIGGITAGSFKRAYENFWNNVRIISAGGRPVNIVNSL
ncbi:MAG: GyaR protein, partial [Firmicutes bacterium]|nr:GyaR protein [Bacillota bacterium]